MYFRQLVAPIIQSVLFLFSLNNVYEVDYSIPVHRELHIILCYVFNHASGGHLCSFSSFFNTDNEP